MLVLDALGISPRGVAGSFRLLGDPRRVNIVLVVLVFVILDRGRLISPAYSRLDAARARASCARA